MVPSRRVVSHPVVRRILGVVFTAAPFVAAVIAAAGARHDLRFTWMAIVATTVSRLVFAVSRVSARTLGVSFVAGTLSAAVVALLAGARAPSGVIAVALVMAGFAAVGAFLLPSTLRRRQLSDPAV
jgi:hypothetical protein